MKHSYAVILLFLSFHSVSAVFSRSEHVIISLPDGAACNYVVDNARGTILFTCPGISVIELKEYCLQRLTSNRDSFLRCMATATTDGARLEMSIADCAVNPVVTIVSCERPRHIIVGVREAGYDYSLQSGDVSDLGKILRQA